MTTKIRMFVDENELNLPENVEDIFNLGKHHPENQVGSNKLLDCGRRVSIGNIIYLVKYIEPQVERNGEHLELKIWLDVYQDA